MKRDWSADKAMSRMSHDHDYGEIVRECDELRASIQLRERAAAEALAALRHWAPLDTDGEALAARDVVYKFLESCAAKSLPSVTQNPATDFDFDTLIDDTTDPATPAHASAAIDAYRESIFRYMNLDENHGVEAARAHLESLIASHPHRRSKCQ